MSSEYSKSEIPRIMNGPARRPVYAPKVPVEWIVHLYRTDAAGLQDDELVGKKVGWRLLARCQDVLMVTASRVACPFCQTEFTEPWIGQPPERVSTCPRCGWRITASNFHASFRHQDLLGHAPTAFTEFMTGFPNARTYAERMRLIDRVVHALHVTGGVTARNLLEGTPRRVLATLDEMAGHTNAQADDGVDTHQKGDTFTLGAGCIDARGTRRQG